MSIRPLTAGVRRCGMLLEVRVSVGMCVGCHECVSVGTCVSCRNVDIVHQRAIQLGMRMSWRCCWTRVPMQTSWMHGATPHGTLRLLLLVPLRVACSLLLMCTQSITTGGRPCTLLHGQVGLTMFDHV